MTSRKKRKKLEEDRRAIFESWAPSAQEDTDDLFASFRKYIDAHVEGETRAFHELRSAAERGLTARPVPLPATRLDNSGGPHPVARMEQARPKGSGTWLSLLLCGSFAVLGGLAYHAWQQWTREPRFTPTSVAAKVTAKTKGTKEAKAVGAAPCVETGPLSKEAGRSEVPAAAKIEVKPHNPAPATAQPEPIAIPVREAAIASESSPMPPSQLHHSSSSPIEAQPTLRALVVNTQGGELRRGPGLNYEIIDVLPVGQWVQGQPSNDRQWLRLADGRFLPMRFLFVSQQDESQATVDRWVRARKANVRALPTLDARVIAQHQEGAALKVIPIHPEWGLLPAGGYIYLSLLTAQAPRPPAPPAPPAPQVSVVTPVASTQLPQQGATPVPSTTQGRFPTLMRVVPPEARIHSGPGTQYQAVGVFFKEHKVEVIELKDGWFRVGNNQFVRMQDLEMLAQTAPAPRM